MNILVFGGTLLMGKQLVLALLKNGHTVTIANRGNKKDEFGDKVQRIVADRTDAQAMKQAFTGKSYDVVYDSLAYCSEDVRNLLEAITCNKYIFTSTGSVYDQNMHLNCVEEEINPHEIPLYWCGRDMSKFGEYKRQAECAAMQVYGHLSPIAVRPPLIVSQDDHTKRLYFYIDHIVNQKPMYIANYDARIPFLRAERGGEFMAFLADSTFTGPINSSNVGTMSLREVAQYVEKKTGLSPILSQEGEPGPLNGFPDFNLTVERAKELGFVFKPIQEEIEDLLDWCISDSECHRNPM